MVFAGAPLASISIVISAKLVRLFEHAPSGSRLVRSLAEARPRRSRLPLRLQLRGEGARFRRALNCILETGSVVLAGVARGGDAARPTRKYVLTRQSALRTVTLDSVHVGVGVCNELEHFVAHVCALAAKHGYVLIVAEDPWVLKHLVYFDTGGAVLDQELGDQVFARGAHILPDGMVERDLLIDCLASNFFIVLTVKGKMSPKHQVSYDAERPAIHALIIRLL